jgi:predicted O-methyltransferase YrrM
LKLQLILYRIRSYSRYIRKSRHRKGYGIHSPFVFYVVRELLYEFNPYYAFKQIDAARRALLKDGRTVNTDTLGESSVNCRKRKKVKDLFREGSLPVKYGKFLFRLINYFEARSILELGTGIGFGTLFLALPDSRSSVTTIEGNRDISGIAKGVFEMVGITNVKVVNGHFKELLPGILEDRDRLDFVFIDGDHCKESTLQYFEMCLPKACNNSVFVFDDIHWSPGMEEAWQTIVDHPSVTVSLDLYRIGVVFFRKECQKQYYRVWY